ncbi:DUF4221 family protein [Algoriphagus halophilus]|uniref:TolB-like 6-blade propeller-like n=1 Tax=Algoriphagus halophilus TaxID=226505 RepID=A0A1N6GF56_9BACT|nr:DUF4221 family protein [Algoriphagus halophilus]SIO06153.1 protein of unknown function [Algoriphagus halophilus]
MNKFILLLLAVTLFLACEEKESRSTSNLLENLSIQVDTIQVDVGEELFNPGGYYISDFNSDRSIGYFFYMENEVHEIDLDNMKLLNRFVYQEDGPDAIPKYPNSFQILPNREIFIGGYAQQGVFTLPGHSINSYKIIPENLNGIPNDAPYSLSNNIHISPDKSTIVGLAGIFGEPLEGMAVVDAEEMNAKIHPLPALDLTHNFQLVFRQGNGASAAGDFQRIQFINDQFIIYSGSTSDIYSYDWKTDSLKLISFPHELVPLKKSGKITNSVTSSESLVEGRRNLSKQITFGQLYYDDEKETYFRFAGMNAQYDDKGRFLRSDVYLFSYDKNWKLTGEKLVEELKNQPYSSFMKDGNIYIPTVQGENPAFVVYAINF